MSTNDLEISRAIGDRLREERARLGMSQEQLGAHGGVTKKTQGAYEQGDRSPDARYLAKVAQVGVNTAYLIEGGATNAMNEQRAGYAVRDRASDGLWLEVLENVLNELHKRGKTMEGEKLMLLVDILADACREQGLDRAEIERHLRLVA
jgi:transcriptional regulator with XRE-family HTH domain